MTKRLDEDAFRSSETAYDKAIRKMEEREAKILSSSALQQAASVTEQIRIQQAPFIQALQPFKDIRQPYQNLIKQNSLGLATTTASLSSVAKTVVPDDALSSITESVNSVAASMQSYRDIKDVLATFEAATITPELQAFQSQLKNNVQVMGNGLSAISDYIGELTLKWDNALALNDVLERSIAAQNFAVVRMLPKSLYRAYEVYCRK